MKNKILGNKLFKSGKVLIAVAGVSVIMTSAVIPAISTASANTNKVTPVHTASNWRANDQKTVDNNMRSQGIDSINDLSNYTVVWGDTLTTIANHFHTTADELKNKFNIVNADFIVAGFKLSDQSQFNSIGRELLSSSITSLNKNTTAAYLQKPTNIYRRSNSNNSTFNTEQKQVVAVNHDYSVTANNNAADKAAANKAAAGQAAADKAAAGQAADKAAADKAAAEQAAGQAADKAAADKAAADQAAADKAAANKAAAGQAAADKAAADKAAADKAAADKAAADKAAADKAAAEQAAADKAAADKAAADKAAADKAAADKAAAEQAAADKAAAEQAAADKAAAEQAAADKAAAEQAAADKAAADKAAADKAAADKAAADKAAAEQAAADKAAAEQAAADKAAADKAAADKAAADKAAADKAAADKAAADKAAAEQAAAKKAAADKAAAEQAAADKAAAEQAAAKKAAADKAAADKAAADKAAADKAAADTPFADKAVHTIYTGTNTYLYTTKELTTIATTPLQGDTSVIAYPDGITTALTGKNAGDLAIPVTYKGQNLYFKGTFEGLTSNGLYPDGYYYALTDTAFYGVVKPTDPSVKLDAPFLNGSTWFYSFDGGSTIYSYQNNVWTGHTFLNAAADKAAADKAAADKAAAEQAAADKAAADKAAAEQAAAKKAAADKAAADKAAADKAAADKAAADKAAADKAAADKAAADKAAADKAAADKAAADKAAADKAAADKAAADKAAADKAAADKAAADKAAADKAAADKAAADKAAADKAAADKAAADKAAADKAAADKAAADKAAGDESSTPLNMTLSAYGDDTVGKYAKSLFVTLTGFDGRPMTVTGIKVSEGNGLTTSYTEEQLQGMGFNVHPKSGNGLIGDLPSQDESKMWDTSNLTVNVDVKLENGQTTTFTDKIIPSLSNNSGDESSTPLNMTLSAYGDDTVGKYAKSLFVTLTGFDGRPMTVTGIKVSEGNGLTTSYTEEQLQGMGFNVHPKSGNGLIGDLPSQDESKMWDTSNLTVNVDVKLENGQTTTFTDKIIPSLSNNSGDESSTPLNMTLSAYGDDTVGKYAKSLFVTLTGFDGRPMTVTGIKVSEGNGLTTSYTEEQLQGMGFNVHPKSGNGLIGDLPSQDESKMWDTSNLTVSVDVKLENGQTTTLTDKIR